MFWERSSASLDAPFRIGASLSCTTPGDIGILADFLDRVVGALDIGRRVKLTISRRQLLRPGNRRPAGHHQRIKIFPAIAPRMASMPIAIGYQVATNSGESSVQCAA